MTGFVRLLAAQLTLLLFLIGLTVLVTGLWWISPAWAMIVAGLVIMLFAIGAELYADRRRANVT